MWNPLSWVMEIAALMAIGLANGGVITFNCSKFNHSVFLTKQSMSFIWWNLPWMKKSHLIKGFQRWDGQKVHLGNIRWWTIHDVGVGPQPNFSVAASVIIFWFWLWRPPLFLQGKPPDWQDFIGIVVLLIINSTISFIEENSAGNAAAALMAGLAPKTKVTT